MYQFFPDKSSNYRYSIILRHPLRVFKSWRKGIFDIVTQTNQTTDSSEIPKSFDDFHFQRDPPKKFVVQGRNFKELYDQWQYVKENFDPNPIIIDSDELLSDPEHMVSKFCAALGIPYNKDMITWDGDPKHIDDWWIPVQPLYSVEFGRICCGNAMYSKEFKKPGKLPSLDEVSEDIRESYEFVKPYYEEMYNARLKPWIEISVSAWASDLFYRGDAKDGKSLE